MQVRTKPTVYCAFANLSSTLLRIISEQVSNSAVTCIRYFCHPPGGYRPCNGERISPSGARDAINWVNRVWDCIRALKKPLSGVKSSRISRRRKCSRPMPRSDTSDTEDETQLVYLINKASQDPVPRRMRPRIPGGCRPASRTCCVLASRVPTRTTMQSLSSSARVQAVMNRLITDTVRSPGVKKMLGHREFSNDDKKQNMTSYVLRECFIHHVQVLYKMAESFAFVETSPV